MHLAQHTHSSAMDGPVREVGSSVAVCGPFHTLENHVHPGYCLLVLRAKGRTRQVAALDQQRKYARGKRESYICR